MTKLLIAISFLFLVGISFANAEQVYYCAEKITNGIRKDKKTGEWERNGFRPDRHTIKFNDDYTKLDGLSHTQMNCFIPFGDENTKRVCYGNFNGGELFQFDKNTLRFFMLHGSIYGYLDNGGDDNWITGGTCEKF
jgi:hypothetical protein